MARRGSRQPHRRQNNNGPSADERTYYVYDNSIPWSTAWSNMFRDGHPSNWPLWLYYAVGVVMLFVLVAFMPESMRQTAFFAVCLLLLGAAVHSKGDGPATWSTLQGWLQPLITLLHAPRQSSSRRSQGQNTYASFGGSSSRAQWEHAQGNTAWQQYQQEAANNSSSSSRCRFVDVEYEDNKPFFVVHLKYRTMTSRISYGLPEGATVAQMDEALQCAVDEFNAADTPAVRKLATPAQLQKVTDLLNKNLNRVVMRDYVSNPDTGASSTSNGQQQQQQQQQQGRQQQQQRRQRPPSKWQQQERELDTAAVAAAPDVEKMSAGALKEFLKQLKVDIPRGVTQQEQLLELAKAATQLWEANRVLRCWQIGEQHPSLLLPAALAIFRQPSHAAAQSAAAEERRQQLKKACRHLRLALHPDKTPKQLAGKQAVFVEAFKALQDAQEKVPSLNS